MQARSMSQAYLKHLFSPTKKLRLFCRILSGAVLTPARMVYISTKLGRSKNTLTMARYKPIDMVDHYRGKICSHSDTYFQKRGKTLCTGRICKKTRTRLPRLRYTTSSRRSLRQSNPSPRSRKPLTKPLSTTRASTRPCVATCSQKSTRSLATKRTHQPYMADQTERISHIWLI